MNHRFFESLVKSGELADIRRSGLGVGDIRGFPIQTSEELLLISVVSDEVEQSGFSVVKLEDISLVRWRTRPLVAWQAVLPRSRPLDAPPVDLASWDTVIRGLVQRTASITIMTENVDQDRCYVGRGIELLDGYVTGEDVDVDGMPNGCFALDLGSITRIDFGDRYVEALERVRNGMNQAQG